MVHVKDVMPVMIAAEDNLAHELNEIKTFALNFGQRALQRVRAHSIGYQMGIAELLHSAASCYEALLAEFGRDIRCP